MLITYRRWDISSDNPVYTLINTSCNNSHVLWLGLRWNFLSFKPVGGQQKQQKDRNLIRFVDRKKRRLTKSSTSVSCVQDEDINMISIDFGISIMILTYLKINKLQM